jgi:hypothetical protein
MFQRFFPSEAGRFRPTASGRHAERARRRRMRSRTDPIEASDVGAGKTGQPSFQRSPGFAHERPKRTVPITRAARVIPLDEDVAAASGASDCSSFRAGCGPPPVGDRRPARLRSSYRAGRNLASIRSGTERGQATGTPGRRCVPGDVGGFDAIPGAGSPRFFAPQVREPSS